MIDLKQLEDLMHQYVSECVPNVNDRLTMQLRLSRFLAWLQKRIKENANAEKSTD